MRVAVAAVAGLSSAALVVKPAFAVARAPTGAVAAAASTTGAGQSA